MKKNNNKSEDKENKVTFKMLWAHPFYNSLIKLGLWLIFFIVLYIFLMAAKPPKNLENNEPEEEVKTEIKVSYVDMKKNLINSELSISYDLGNYKINGLVNNNILSGTLEDNEGNLIKIKYDGENIYQVKKDEEIIINEMFTDININYLLPSKIIEIVDNHKVIGVKSADELTYSYDVDGVAISLYLNESKIYKIIVLENELTYNLEYKEVINEE